MKFERKYRDCIKGTETRLGHRHVMKYQCNIMGTSIYKMSVSQSCLRSFYAIPIFPFKFPKFFIYLSPVIFLACLRLFFYKIYMYMVYRDVITMLIFGLISFTTISISLLVKLLLVRYSIACLRLFVVILQDLHCLQRFYHNSDHWGTLPSHQFPHGVMVKLYTPMINVVIKSL